MFEATPEENSRLGSTILFRTLLIVSVIMLLVLVAAAAAIKLSIDGGYPVEALDFPVPIARYHSEFQAGSSPRSVELTLEELTQHVQVWVNKQVKTGRYGEGSKILITSAEERKNRIRIRVSLLLTKTDGWLQDGRWLNIDLMGHLLVEQGLEREIEIDRYQFGDFPEGSVADSEVNELLDRLRADLNLPNSAWRSFDELTTFRLRDGILVIE